MSVAPRFYTLSTYLLALAMAVLPVGGCSCSDGDDDDDDTVADASFDSSVNVPDAAVDASSTTPDAAVDAPSTAPDADTTDAPPGAADAAPDAEPSAADAAPDAEPPDAVPPDAEPPDAEPPDAGPPDAMELGQVEVMFSVSEGSGSQGLTGTGVNDESPNAPSSIYGSDGVGPSHTPGTNETYVLNAMLGLEATDDVDAHSILKASPANPVFYFSVKDVASQDEGQITTPVRRSSDEGEDPGDIFSSQGVITTGPPTNMLYTDEVQLGQQPEDEGQSPKDNLNALDLDVDNPEVVYFSVTKDSVGLAGTGVALTDASERGCSIYRSWLDGTNELVFACSEIGLLADDEVDALVAIGTADPPDEIYFSVDAASVGASGTAVETQQIAGEQEGDIFWSAGDDTNGLLVDEEQLGLQPTTSGDPVDELDALTIRDEELVPKFEFFEDCPLVPPPDIYEYPIYWMAEHTSYIGDGLFMVSGYQYNYNTGDSTEEVWLYSSLPDSYLECVRLAVITLSFGREGNPYFITAVPGSSWSSSDPTTDLTFWAWFYDSNLDAYFFVELDGAGTVVNETPVTSVPWDPPPYPEFGQLIYKPAVDHFAVIYNPDWETDGPMSVMFFARPDGSGTMDTDSLWFYPLPKPCSAYRRSGSYDPVSGGLDFIDPSDQDQRICQVTNEIHFRELPRTWTGSPTIIPDWFLGTMIVPGTYMLQAFYDAGYNWYLRRFLPYTP